MNLEHQLYQTVVSIQNMFFGYASKIYNAITILKTLFQRLEILSPYPFLFSYIRCGNCVPGYLCELNALNSIQDGLFRDWSRMGEGKKATSPQNISQMFYIDETWHSFILLKEDLESV